VRPLARRQRVAVAVWVVLAAALWNAIFEMMVVRGAKEYLFRAALHDAGRRSDGSGHLPRDMGGHALDIRHSSRGAAHDSRVQSAGGVHGVQVRKRRVSTTETAEQTEKDHFVLRLLC
jgi:hypothetical protein